MRVGCASAALFGTIPPFAARRKRGPESVRGTDSGDAPICGSAAKMRNGPFEGTKIRTSLVTSDTTTRNCVGGRRRRRCGTGPCFTSVYVKAELHANAYPESKARSLGDLRNIHESRLSQDCSRGETRRAICILCLRLG